MPLPTHPQQYYDPASFVLGTRVGGGGHGVWMAVECPCPPVRNDIVTLRHLFSCGQATCSIRLSVGLSIHRSVMKTGNRHAAVVIAIVNV